MVHSVAMGNIQVSLSYTVERRTVVGTYMLPVDFLIRSKSEFDSRDLLGSSSKSTAYVLVIYQKCPFSTYIVCTTCKAH